MAGKFAMAGKFVGLALLAALGGSTAARADDPASLRLDWVPVGFHAPFFLALGRGYYKAAGLDVTIGDGKGSSHTAQLIGAGADTFGWADSAVTAMAAAKGVPVKVVLGVFRKTAASLNAPADRNIKTIEAIKGHTVMSCAGSGSQTFLPAYLKAIHLAPTDIKIVNVDCQAIWPLVAQGRADVSTGYTPPVRTNFARLGVFNINHFDYADAGIVLPSHGVLASTKTIETNPDLVRRFVAASARAWVEAVKDPRAAVDAMVHERPLIKGQEEFLEGEFRGWMDYLDTDRTKGKPFGWQSADDWKDAEKLMVEYAAMKPLPSVESYFTNQFIAP
jgi:NitT/TauT family transport system substrate-binding protein